MYDLEEPIESGFEEFLKLFGDVKYPLGKGSSFISIETGDFLLTGNIGLKELRLTVKHGSAADTRELLERRFKDYMVEQRAARTHVNALNEKG